MLRGYKSPWSSKTILSALLMILTLLGTLGVHALSDDAQLKKIVDAAAVILGILTQAGVITFRVNATEKVGTDPNTYTNQVRTLLLPLLLLLPLGAAVALPGCAKLNDALGLSALNNAPTNVQRLGQAVVLYDDTIDALNLLQDAGQIPASLHDEVEKYRVPAWTALLGMRAAIASGSDSSYQSALAEFNRNMDEIIKRQFAAKDNPPVVKPARAKFHRAASQPSPLAPPIPSALPEP